MSGFVEAKFFIKGGDVGFANRQKDIFDVLNVAEMEKNERQSKEGMDCDSEPVTSPSEEVMDVVPARNTRKRLRSEMKQFRGKESIFKRPEAPPPKFNRKSTPDYQRNPHRWTKYSLGDVSQDDMSERSNTAAALSFLRELEARKNTEPMEEDGKGSHIIFKPRKKVVSQESSDSIEIVKSSFKSTKLIMPEYVVGQEKKKTKKNTNKPSSDSDKSNKAIKLSHLEEEEDDDE